MKTVIRNSMFETNSSSMHSVVIVNKPREELYDDHNEFFEELGLFGDVIFDDSLEGGVLHRYILDLSKETPLRVGRRPGIILTESFDKLMLYIQLEINNIFRMISLDAYLNKASLQKEFDEKFNNFVENLQENLFSKLHYIVTVIPPKYKIVKDKYSKEYEIQFESENFSFFGVCDETLQELYGELQNPDTLFSFIFDCRSMAIIGGDEYNTNYHITKMVKNSIDYDALLLGAIQDDEVNEWH